MESECGVTDSTNVNNKPEEFSSSTEREARSVALEKAYVHDVYQQIASNFSSSDSRYRVWPKVKQFLLDLEPASIVCDVGMNILCPNNTFPTNLSPFTNFWDWRLYLSHVIHC